MIDATCPAASWFLWIAPILFLLVYALPILLAPFAWARWFRWSVNARDDLALYYGRCTGAAAVAICVACLRGAAHPRANAILFELVACAGALLTCVHVAGALEKRQPWTETAEIALYAGLTVLALAVRPS
jgi:hypothetical protein